MTLPVFLLIVFLICGLVYARATKELQRLEKLRLAKYPLPDDAFGPATDFARKMRLTLAPASEDLKKFCEDNGHTHAYQRANRLLYGSIAIALVCAAVILKTAPVKPPTSP